MNAQLVSHPVSLFRDKGKILSKATTDIEEGALRVPVDLKKIDNIATVVAQADGVLHHPHSVIMHVCWPTSEEEQLAGIEEESQQLHFRLMPEFNLPKAPTQKGEPLNWSLQNSCHLFWGIQRQEKDEDEPNCELRFRKVVPVIAAPPVSTFPGAQVPCLTDTFNVHLPYIVNTQKIARGATVMLKWQVLVKEKAEKKNRTWADEVKKTEAKRFKKS